MRRHGIEIGDPTVLRESVDQRTREVGNEIVGAYGMVVGSDTPGRGIVQEVTLFSPGPSIYGGTDQVQRNILGERVLGLPKEPGPAKDTPYRDLLVNR